MKIRKAIFPVAGLGTEFLPVTKKTVKEMLPVVDKPLIQYAVEEAYQSGITEIIFVTDPCKNDIVNHFGYYCELEHTLMARGKEAQCNMIHDLIPESGSLIYTRQNEPLGLGHAIWCARNIVGYEPFAVLLADDLIKAEKPVLKQLIEKFDELQSSIVSVVEVEKKDTHKYGILDADPLVNSVTNIRGLVEKPQPADAPSNLAIIGRYILTPEIFDILAQKETGPGGEIQITDAMARLLNKQDIYGYEYIGTRFDCGSKAGIQMANLSFSLDRPDIRDRLLPYIRNVIERY